MTPNPHPFLKRGLFSQVQGHCLLPKAQERCHLSLLVIWKLYYLLVLALDKAMVLASSRPTLRNETHIP